MTRLDIAKCGCKFAQEEMLDDKIKHFISVYERMGLLSAFLLFRQLPKSIYSIGTALYWLNVVGMSVSCGIDSSTYTLCFSIRI